METRDALVCMSRLNTVRATHLEAFLFFCFFGMHECASHRACVEIQGQLEDVCYPLER